MTTSRRTFLKWSGVSALGTVVFAACGIPEDELIVQSPAQMPEDLVSGLEAWYATTCAQCGAGEGIIVRVIEGRAIKIEGNPDHPVSQGKTSVRCQAGLQALYNPDRLESPMLREGDQFRAIPWEEALNRLQGYPIKQVYSRRALMKRAVLGAAAVTVAALSAGRLLKNRNSSSQLPGHGSIFEPRQQDLLHHWREKMSRFRLR